MGPLARMRKGLQACSVSQEESRGSGSRVATGMGVSKADVVGEMAGLEKSVYGLHPPRHRASGQHGLTQG